MNQGLDLKKIDAKSEKGVKELSKSVIFTRKARRRRRFTVAVTAEGVHRQSKLEREMRAPLFKFFF